MQRLHKYMSSVTGFTTWCYRGNSCRSCYTTIVAMEAHFGISVLTQLCLSYMLSLALNYIFKLATAGIGSD